MKVSSIKLIEITFSILMTAGFGAELILLTNHSKWWRQMLIIFFAIVVLFIIFEKIRKCKDDTKQENSMLFLSDCFTLLIIILTGKTLLLLTNYLPFTELVKTIIGLLICIPWIIGSLYYSYFITHGYQIH